jgi:hypothetical protein
LEVKLRYAPTIGWKSRYDGNPHVTKMLLKSSKSASGRSYI